MSFDFMNIFPAFMALFAVIDITGSIPIILDLKEKGGRIESEKATLVAFIIMILFLFFGSSLLGLFGVDIASFAIAGAMVLFFLALEMILGINIFRDQSSGQTSIVPLAFPLIAGAGSITTLISLMSKYSRLEVAVALTLNMLVVYIVLRYTRFFEKILGQNGIMILKKIFGVILLAISVKLFMSNLANSVEQLFPQLLK